MCACICLLEGELNQTGVKEAFLSVVVSQYQKKRRMLICWFLNNRIVSYWQEMPLWCSFPGSETSLTCNGLWMKLSCIGSNGILALGAVSWGFSLGEKEVFNIRLGWAWSKSLDSGCPNVKPFPERRNLINVYTLQGFCQREISDRLSAQPGAACAFQGRTCVGCWNWCVPMAPSLSLESGDRSVPPGSLGTWMSSFSRMEMTTS